LTRRPKIGDNRFIGWGNAKTEKPKRKDKKLSKKA
jgi:hypothetical protein